MRVSGCMALEFSAHWYESSLNVRIYTQPDIDDGCSHLQF